MPHRRGSFARCESLFLYELPYVRERLVEVLAWGTSDFVPSEPAG